MQQLINDIIKLLKKKPSHFFQFKRIYGRVTGYYKGDHIELDYRKDLVQTIIHESVHILYPGYSETKVIGIERQILKKLSNIQAAEILQIVARKIKHVEKTQSYLKRQ